MTWVFLFSQRQGLSFDGGGCPGEPRQSGPWKPLGIGPGHAEAGGVINGSQGARPGMGDSD